MNSERGNVGSEMPQLAGPPQLPPHQLLGLAGLVAGAGMGHNVAAPNINMSMSMHNPMSSDNSASLSPSGLPRSVPSTSASSVGSLMSGMSGMGGPPRPPTLPQALLNMDGGAGVGWGGWGDLGDGLGMERGRSRNWTYEETLELISLYTSDEWQAKFSSEKKNHRAIWASLAAALTRRKDVSGDEARQRLNNLKALYNRTRRQLLAGEISSPQWEYWEPLHTFLGRPQPFIPITATTPTYNRPPPLHGFPQHQYQPRSQASPGHHQGWLGALGLSPHMPHARDTPPRPFMKTNLETRIDDTPRESLQVSEDRSGSEFSHHNNDDTPIPVSPDHFLSEGNDHDEPTPVPPTPNQQQKPESYQLRHNNHLTIVLEALARDESFMDVTLTAQGRSLKAHKSVLSAVSSYFRGVLRDNPCQHPIIIMPRDVRFEELYSIVNYIYKGEMTVAAEDLTSLLKTAEILQVSGLAPSDSSATVNPQTESLPMGNVRSSSNSSSSISSSSNIPPLSRTSKTIKIPFQSLATPPARPKSIESMINPADFIDVDMTCVKEEVVSEGEEEKDEPTSKKPCSQPAESSQPPEGTQQATQGSQPPECSQPTRTQSKDNDDASDQVILGFPSPDEQTFEQPIPSTSSHEAEFQPLGVKSDPEKGFGSQAAIPFDNPQPLQCPHCDEQYRDVESIDSHLRIKHPTKPSFTCKCGRIFTRQIHHQAHTRMCPNSS